MAGQLAPHALTRGIVVRMFVCQANCQRQWIKFFTGPCLPGGNFFELLRTLKLNHRRLDIVLTNTLWLAKLTLVLVIFGIILPLVSSWESPVSILQCVLFQLRRWQGRQVIVCIIFVGIRNLSWCRLGFSGVDCVKNLIANVTRAMSGH